MPEDSKGGADPLELDWLGIARQVADIFKQLNRDDLDVVRVTRHGTELYVVFRDLRGSDRGLQGWHYDLSTGNYEGRYPGDPNEYALDLIHASILESSHMHPAKAGEIRWKVQPGMTPGPPTLNDYDKRWGRR